MLNLKLFSATLFLLVVFYVGLSANVIRWRRLTKISLGDKHNHMLQRAIRAHANCAEYAPLILLELFVLTTLGINSILMAVLCLALIAGRVIHAYSLTDSELQEPPRYWGRITGMMLTFFCLFISALTILIYTLKLQ